jgi:hypothetical protein
MPSVPCVPYGTAVEAPPPVSGPFSYVTIYNIEKTGGGIVSVGTLGTHGTAPRPTTQNRDPRASRTGGSSTLQNGQPRAGRPFLSPPGKVSARGLVGSARPRQQGRGDVQPQPPCVEGSGARASQFNRAGAVLGKARDNRQCYNVVNKITELNIQNRDFNNTKFERKGRDIAHNLGYASRSTINVITIDFTTSSSLPKGAA